MSGDGKMTNSELVIGLLEDDADQASLIEAWLLEAGYVTRLFRSAAEFRRRLGAGAVDLLLLDWNLPESSGIEVLHALRTSSHPSLPVIFLTARVREEDIVQGLNSGADDYVSKPAKKAELLARIAAVLRRRGTEAEKLDTLVLGVYIFDLLRRVASIEGREMELTNREFDLALYLFRRQGRIVSRNSLLEDVWNLSAEVSTRTVDTHISRLRKKLELDDQHGWRLAAVYQHGYRLEPI